MGALLDFLPAPRSADRAVTGPAAIFLFPTTTARARWLRREGLRIAASVNGASVANVRRIIEGDRARAGLVGPAVAADVAEALAVRGGGAGRGRPAGAHPVALAQGWRRRVTARPVMVGECVVGEMRSRYAARSFSLADRRVLEIIGLLRHRFGPSAPPGWVGWVRPLLDHVVRRAASEGRPATVPALVDRVRLLCPSLAPEDVEPTAAAALAAPGRWTARQLGDQLRLTLDERSALGIRTFRAVGQTATDQRAAKRERDRARQERRRRDAGQVERSIWVATSTEEEARRLGVSSRTLRRRRAKEAERPGSVANSYGDHIGEQPRTLGEEGAPRRARSPATALAEVVIRSTGHRPSAVVVEGDAAIVVLDPARVREGPILAPHLAETLREIGIRASARFDGRAAIFLTIDREVA